MESHILFKILKSNYFFVHLKMNFIQLLIYIIVRRVEKKKKAAMTR